MLNSFLILPDTASVAQGAKATQRQRHETACDPLSSGISHLPERHYRMKFSVLAEESSHGYWLPWSATMRSTMAAISLIVSYD